MACKRSRLWLNKPKRKSILPQLGSVHNTPSAKRLRVWSPPSSAIAASSSRGTPLSRPFSNRRCWRQTPTSAVCKTKKDDNEWVEYGPDLVESSVQTGQDIEGESETGDLLALLNTALEKLSVHGFKAELISFLELVSDDHYPLDTLVLPLFLETVRFYSLSSSTKMWWWPETMKFWRTCYRLFHGKVMALMAGPRNLGQLQHYVQYANKLCPANKLCLACLSHIPGGLS